MLVSVPRPAAQFVRLMANKQFEKVILNNLWIHIRIYIYILIFRLYLSASYLLIFCRIHCYSFRDEWTGNNNINNCSEILRPSTIDQLVSTWLDLCARKYNNIFLEWFRWDFIFNIRRLIADFGWHGIKYPPPRRILAINTHEIGGLKNCRGCADSKWILNESCMHNRHQFDLRWCDVRWNAVRLIGFLPLPLE